MYKIKVVAHYLMLQFIISCQEIMQMFCFDQGIYQYEINASTNLFGLR